MKLCALTAAAVLAGAASSSAAPGTITASITPAGPFQPGDSLVVTLRIAGYTNATMIDAYQFRVSYPAALLEFAGPFSHGTGAPGLTQQWLALPDQESAAEGYQPAAADDSSVPGFLLIDYADLGYSEREGGTTAAEGFLVSFAMKAIAPGTGNITPSAPAGGVTFFDEQLNNAGSPSFAGVPFTVIAPDSDSDGLPDAWETAHGLDPNDDGSVNPRNGPDGDEEGDGLTNLWELALIKDPRVHDDGAAPSLSSAVNPGDGRRYLMLHWTRRIGGGGFTFTPEVADALSGWDGSAGNFLELSASPNGDGLTEKVTTRIRPAMNSEPRRQVRVTVSVP